MLFSLSKINAGDGAECAENRELTARVMTLKRKGDNSFSAAAAFTAAAAALISSCVRGSKGCPTRAAASAQQCQHSVRSQARLKHNSHKVCSGCDTS